MTIVKGTSNLSNARAGPYYSNSDKDKREIKSEMYKLFSDTAVRANIITGPVSQNVSRLKSSMVWYTTLKEEDDFMRLIGQGVEDAHVVLMLALLPNISTLIVDRLSPYPLLDWYLFLSRSSIALRALEKLLIYETPPAQNGPVARISLQILDMLPKLRSVFMGCIAIGAIASCWTPYRHELWICSILRRARLAYDCCAYFSAISKSSDSTTNRTDSSLKPLRVQATLQHKFSTHLFPLTLP